MERNKTPATPPVVRCSPPTVRAFHLAPPLTSDACRTLAVLSAPPEQFPRTTIVHAYLLGHKDFVSALAVVPGNGGVFLLSGGGDGMVGLWNAEAGKE